VVTIGTPHLFWLRDVLGLRRYSVKDRLTVFIEQRTLRSPLCRRILAVSELARAQHSRYYPELASKVEVREPGFNSAVFARSDAAELRSEVRRELGFSADEFVGVFVGNNFELKGLTHVLAALSERRRLGKETKLIVIGRGDLARFQREINERGLESDVRLLGPVTSGVERYYFAGDFFILLSAIETYCIAVLEALGAKLPVIITRGMGVTPVVERGECGIVVDDPADTTAVLRALGQLESAEVRRTLGERGRTLSQERDWKNLCQGMVELYRAELHRVGLHRVELHRDELT
jgi:UDP-glucose:(heptosyl)LPS alpha-1,3-glucosyltransferase